MFFYSLKKKKKLWSIKTKIESCLSLREIPVSHLWNMIVSEIDCKILGDREMEPHQWNLGLFVRAASGLVWFGTIAVTPQKLSDIRWIFQNSLVIEDTASLHG